MTTVEVLARKFGEGDAGVFFSARTRVNGEFFSATGDTEEEALTNLRDAISRESSIALPPGYPKIVEVAW